MNRLIWNFRGSPLLHVLAAALLIAIMVAVLTVGR